MENHDEHEGYCSQISCDPKSMTPQLLVNIVATEKDRDQEWTVKRRYSEFDELRERLEHFFMSVRVNQCFGCRWFSQSLREFEFPRKRWITSTQRYVIHERRHRLDRFSRLLCAHTFSAIPKCQNCRYVPFRRIRDFFTSGAMALNHITVDHLHQVLKAERFAPIMDPKKSKLEFRRGQGIWKVLQVEKPRQTRVVDRLSSTKEEKEERPSMMTLSVPSVSSKTTEFALSPRSESASWELTSPTRHTAAKQA